MSQYITDGCKVFHLERDRLKTIRKALKQSFGPEAEVMKNQLLHWDCLMNRKPESVEIKTHRVIQRDAVKHLLEDNFYRHVANVATGCVHQAYDLTNSFNTRWYLSGNKSVEALSDQVERDTSFHDLIWYKNLYYLIYPLGILNLKTFEWVDRTS